MEEEVKCSSGKICYTSFSQAQTAVNKANKTRAHTYRDGKRINRLSKARPKRVYHCLECGYFHLTSQTKKGKKKVRL